MKVQNGSKDRCFASSYVEKRKKRIPNADCLPESSSTFVKTNFQMSANMTDGEVHRCLNGFLPLTEMAKNWTTSMDKKDRIFSEMKAYFWENLRDNAVCRNMKRMIQ